MKALQVGAPAAPEIGIAAVSPAGISPAKYFSIIELVRLAQFAKVFTSCAV